MMTKDLTREEIFAACEALAGQAASGASGVTGHAVCKLLGRGSRTTVYRHTDEWKKMQVPSSDSTALGQLLASTQRLIVDFVDNAINEERSRASFVQEGARGEVAQLGSMLAAAHKAQSDAQTDNDALREQIAALEDQHAQELAELQGRLTAVTEELAREAEGLRSELAVAQADLIEAGHYAEHIETSLKQELQDTREEFADHTLGHLNKDREVARAVRSLASALPLQSTRKRPKSS